MNHPEVDSILFLTPGFAEGDKDSTCIPALQDFLDALIEFRPAIKLSLVSLHYPFRNGKFSWRGNTFYSAGCQNKSGFRRIIGHYNFFRIALSIIRKHKPQVIHVFWFGECAMPGFVLSGIFRIPIVISVMGQELNQENSFFSYLIKKNIFVVTPSLFASKILEKLKSNFLQTMKINWGVHNISKYLNEKTLPLGKREIDILGVGSLSELKNYSLFIDVMFELKKRGYKVNACIIGDGEEKEWLLNQIDELQLNNEVRILGELSRENTIRVMSNSKILLHTSEFESFGMVFAEAIELGLKIVSKDVGVASEIEGIFLAGSMKDFADCCEAAIISIKSKSGKKVKRNSFNAIESAISYWSLYITLQIKKVT